MNKNFGIITKCLGGLYTVESLSGIYECKARGVFRSKGIIPLVGDKVEIKDNTIVSIG